MSLLRVRLIRRTSFLVGVIRCSGDSTYIRARHLTSLRQPHMLMDEEEGQTGLSFPSQKRNWYCQHAEYVANGHAL